MKEVFKNIGGLFAHPIDTFDEMKFKRYFSWPLVLIVMAAWFFIEIVARQYVGFRFNQSRPDSLNILVILARTVLPFLLFCVANWAVCTLMDGEGKFSEICTYVTYALIPYIAGLVIRLGLTNLLTLEEAIFIQWLMIGITLFCVILLYQAERVVHQFSFMKTVGTLLLTLFAMLIIVILGFLLYALFQQIIVFIGTIASELAFRYL